MKNSYPGILILCVGLMVAFGGCGKKADAQSELDRAASLLEKPAEAPAAGAQAKQATQGATAAISPSEQMKQAAAAYKSGNLGDAVKGLQTLRSAPAMSAEQRIAVNDATAAVMAEIYARAAKGDAGAMQAVKQYEQMQTQSR